MASVIKITATLMKICSCMVLGIEEAAAFIPKYKELLFEKLIKQKNLKTFLSMRSFFIFKDIGICRDNIVEEAENDAQHYYKMKRNEELLCYRYINIINFIL